MERESQLQGFSNAKGGKARMEFGREDAEAHDRDDREHARLSDRSRRAAASASREAERPIRELRDRT